MSRSEYQRQWYLANRESRLAYRRDYYAAHGPSPRASSHTAAYQKRHPLATSAHRAVTRAVRLGRIERQPCEICDAPQAQAHHAFGYEREHRFDVWWLCSSHHGEMHRFVRQ